MRSLIVVSLLLVAAPAAAQRAQQQLEDAIAVVTADEDVTLATEHHVCAAQADAVRVIATRARATTRRALIHRLVRRLDRPERALRQCLAAAIPPDPLAGGPMPSAEVRLRGTVRATLDPPSQTDDRFDAAIVMRMVQTRQAALRACYERELRTNPELAGAVTFELTVEESGSVAPVRIVASTIQEAVPACVVTVVSRFRFNPGADGGTSTFRIRLDFALAEPTPAPSAPPPSAPPPSAPSIDLRDRVGS
jgi:TonB family protein